MAHLYKRKNKDGKEMPTWYIFIERDGKPPIRETTKTANKQLADKYLTKRKQEVWDEERLGVKPDMALSAVVKLFLGDKTAKRKQDTTDNYEAILNWWIEQLGDIPVRKIEQTLIVNTIKKREGKNANATLNRHLAALRTCLRYAWRVHKLLESVPAFFLYQEPKARVRWLKPWEIVKLLDALPLHMRDMAEFSLATGLRQGNVKGLQWSEVDLVRRNVTIEGIKMKNGETFSLPLSQAAVDVLVRQVGKHQEAVFTYRGKPVRAIGNATWKAAVERAGLVDFRWHDLRHTWASMLIQSGVPVKALQVLGAWETPSMVDKYAHQDTEALRPFAGVIDTIFGSMRVGVGADAQITTHPASAGGLSLVVDNVNLAEGVGFEPTEVVETSALFKSAALSHSATPPGEPLYRTA